MRKWRFPWAIRAPYDFDEDHLYQFEFREREGGLLAPVSPVFVGPLSTSPKNQPSFSSKENYAL